MRLRCGVPLVLLALAGCPGVASAAAGKPRLTVSRAAAEGGQRVAVAGRGFASRQAVRLTLARRTVRSLRTGPRGAFRVVFRVPRVAAGRYVLAARTRGRTVRLGFRVLARAVLPVPSTPPVEPGPAPPVPPPPPPPPPKLVAVGDIACRPGLAETSTACRQARTATLAEGLAPTAVAVLGDNQYEHGELAEFEAVYDPTWGRLKAGTRPAVGNHEYEGDPERDSAPGYFTYFGAVAAPEHGYYSWTLGAWTLIALNSGAIQYTRTGGGAALPDDCHPVSCAAGSAQETWLRAELEALPDEACVLAYWHHPRFSSGWGGMRRDHPETGPLFAALHEHGAELVLTGHAHNYERFEPVDPAGTPDASTGITQFVVGTGGRNLFTDPGPQHVTSEELITDAFGVLELTLAPGAWQFRFVAEDGSVPDEGGGACHDRPA